MQTTSQTLLSVLQSNVRDFVPGDLIEFYAPDVTSLVPGLAERRFASTSLVWFGWQYDRQSVTRGATRRYIDERFNTVGLTFSNVDRELGEWLSGVAIEGYRVVVRAVSRSVENNSIVLFVGRCERSISVNNTTVSITIKQDLGSIRNELPAKKFTHACPLKFKGADCLGAETLIQKSTSYRNAATCDKSWQQCVEYNNTRSFQGVRFNSTTGSFVLRERSSLGPTTKATKQWSSQESTPVNEHVPIGLGRTQLEFTPIASADTGRYLYGHWVAGEGPIAKFLNVRNVTPGWALRFQDQNTDGTPQPNGSYVEHLGEYGQVANQQSKADILGTVHYSRRAYVEGSIEGQNPDTGDPAPTVVGTVMWPEIPTATGGTKYDPATKAWTDNPVDHVRHLLTSENGLQYDPRWIDDEAAIETARYCDEPLYDRSGGEDINIVDNGDIAATTFQRYRSTGLIDGHYYTRQIAGSGQYSAEIPAQYNTWPGTAAVFDEFGQPTGQFSAIPPPSNLVPNPHFRKRFTANWHLRKGVKVSDFLFRQLLPSFNGYLVTGANGKLQIKVERSAIQSRSSGPVTSAMNTIDVYDGTRLRNISSAFRYVLIQDPASPSTPSVVRQVIGADYLEISNLITIGAPSSGQSGMNCQIFGASNVTSTSGATSTTFSGGSTYAPGIARVVVDADSRYSNGRFTAGVRIDGVDVGGGAPQLLPDQIDPDFSGEIAAMIAANLNGNPNLRNAQGVPLRDYIEAVWEPSNPRTIVFRSKQITLILDAPFDQAYGINALVTHFYLPFSDGTDGAPSSIIKDSFEWPVADRQNAHNQFSITYQDAVQDYQPVTVIENDYEHQEAVNQINKIEVMGGECVDNYHQADRLLLAARYKYRESDFFVRFETAGLGLLLEEGDIILVNHSTLSSYRNYLYRVEEVSVSADHRVSVVARLYSDAQYPEQPVPKTVTLTRSIDWQSASPNAVPEQLVQFTSIPNSGNTVRVTFRFTDSIAGQFARVFLRRRDPVSGEYVDASPVDTGIQVFPDAQNLGIVEIPGLIAGSDLVLIPYSSAGFEGVPTPLSVPTDLPVDLGGGGGGTGVTDGDKDDIVVSGNGTSWLIDSNAVTFAKMQDINSERILGRTSSGTGDIEQLTVGTGLVLANGQLRGGREVLTANRTYYVRTDGSDSNDGLANTSGGAFLTIQKAVDVAGTLDPAIYDITIQVAPGTYDGTIFAVSLTQIRNLFIKGDTRFLAGISYVDNSASRVPVGYTTAATGGYGGVGNVTITRGTSGAGGANRRLTIQTGPQTPPNVNNPDFAGDGWAAGDKVIVYNGSASNQFSEHTLSAVGTNTIDIATDTFPAIASPSSGYMVTFVPNTVIAPTTAPPSGSNGIVSAINTKQMYVSGFRINSHANAADCINPQGNAQINAYNVLLDCGGVTNASGINGTQTQFSNYGPVSANGALPTTIIRATYGIAMQGNGFVIARVIRAASITTNAVLGVDRSYLDILGSVSIRAGTAFRAQRNANLDCRALGGAATVSIGATTAAFSPNPRTINTTAGSADLSFILT